MDRRAAACRPAPREKARRRLAGLSSPAERASYVYDAGSKEKSLNTASIPKGAARDAHADDYFNAYDYSDAYAYGNAYPDVDSYSYADSDAG